MSVTVTNRGLSITYYPLNGQIASKDALFVLGDKPEQQVDVVDGLETRRNDSDCDNVAAIIGVAVIA